MVGDSSNIVVSGFLWDYSLQGNVAHLALHDVKPDDVYAVLSNSPIFFDNVPGRTATHVMVGPDNKDRVLYVALLATSESGIWQPVAGWESRLARRIYSAER